MSSLVNEQWNGPPRLVLVIFSHVVVSMMPLHPTTSWTLDVRKIVNQLGYGVGILSHDDDSLEMMMMMMIRLVTHVASIDTLNSTSNRKW